MSHLECHGPIAELRAAFTDSATEAGNSGNNASRAFNNEDDPQAITAERLRQVLIGVTADMMQQQREMQQQQEFMRQQQQQFNQLVQLLLERPGPTRIVENQIRIAETTPPPQQGMNNGRTPNRATATLSARSSTSHPENAGGGNSIK